MVDPLFTHDRYVIRRRLWRLVGAGFDVRDARGASLLYVDHRFWSMNQKLDVYTTDDRQTPLFHIRSVDLPLAPHRFELSIAQTGEILGCVIRQSYRSFRLYWTSKWQVIDPQGLLVCTFLESNQFFTFAHRIGGLTGMLFPLKFDGCVEDVKRCVLRQSFSPLVARYTLDFSDDPERLLDRRLMLLSALLPIALEERHG